MVDNYYDHLGNEQLKQLMNSNNLDAYYYYALRVIDSDIQEAIDCLVHAAKNGHVLSAEYYSEFLYEIIASRGFNIDDPDDARFMISHVKFLESIVDSTPAVPYFLSLIFYGDYLGEPDVDKALHYMNMAADKEYPPAFDWLGNYYSDGPEEVRDYDKAIDYYNKAIQKDDPYGYYNLGICYLIGEGVEEDEKKAFNYIFKAALKGCKSAYELLSRLYLKGRGVDFNLKESIKWARKAAEVKRYDGLLEVAHYYFDNKDYENSYKIYFELAEKNVSDAQYYVGLFYSNGYYVKQSYELAVKYYKLAADQNHRTAYNNLAYLYEEGNSYVQKNIDLAIEYYKKAIELGSATAMTNLAFLYDEQENYELAFKYFKMAADNNNVTGQFYVGLYYDRGYYVKQSDELAFKYYKLAADQDHDSACNNIAYAYDNGNSYVKQNTDLAIAYYKKAIGLGNTTAMTNLAIYYKDNDEYELAFKYFKMAADKGDSSGQFNVGLFYDNGYYVEQNDELAFKYYMLSAKQDNPVAYNNLAYIYENGNSYVEQNIDLAIEYYNKAIELGNITAITNLALLYRDQANYELAFKYFMMAVDKGSASAMFYVGLFYDRGYFVKKDDELAFKYYKMAADQNHPIACNNLAYAFEHGLGVELDIEQAIYYYQKASELDDSSAMINLAYLYDSQNNYELAFKYFMMAANEEEPDGQFNVGLYYSRGYYVEQNYEQAYKYYKLAADQDHPIACNNLGYMYANGNSYVEVNTDLAIEYYKKSIELGNITAITNLASLYEEQNNYELAFKYYKMAADRGDSKGSFNVGLYYNNGYYVEKDIVQAVYWYQKSIEENEHSTAYNNLAFIYSSDEPGINKDVKKAIELFEKAIELGNVTAMYNLAHVYYEEEGYIDYYKALEYANLALDNDYQAAEDLVKEIQEAIDKLSDDYVDSASFKNVFISWNHNDRDLKNRIVDIIEDKGYSVWKSDADCDGKINESCKKGVKGSEIAIFLMTDHYFESKWMCQELRWAYEKYKDQPNLVIPIWLGQRIEETRNNPKGMPEEFKWLSQLGGIFSEDEIYRSITTRVSNAISMKRLSDHQKDLKNKSSTYTMFLSNFVQTDQDSSIDFKHNIDDKFYIKRTLYDSKGNPYSEEDVINSSQHLLIVGGGGMGKSLYLQKLICTFQNEDRCFFRFNIKEVAFYFEENPNDTMDDFITAKVNLSSDMPSTSINNNDPLYAFDKVHSRYILIDALDEFSNSDIITLETLFKKLSRYASKNNTHFIFTARSGSFERDLENEGFGNVLSLAIKELSDEEARRFVSNIYEDFYLNNNVKEIIETTNRVKDISETTNKVAKPLNSYLPGLKNFTNLSLEKSINSAFNTEGGDSTVDFVNKDDVSLREKVIQNTLLEPELVLKSLDKLSDDIKRNPLLLSNFIILVMREKRIPEKKVDIIEKSSKILFNDLEKARDATHDKIDRELLNHSSYFLEYISFCRSNGNTSPVQNLIASAIEDNDYLDNKYIPLANDLYKFFKTRAIIVGDENNCNVYHEIFKAYFACRFIYHKVYKENNESGSIKFIDHENNVGQNRLTEYVEDVFEDKHPWIEIIPLLFTYLDYHSYQLGSKKGSKRTIETSKVIVFDGEEENITSKQAILDIIDDGNLYNLDWFSEIFKSE